MKSINYSTYNEYRDSGIDWLGKIPSDWKTFPIGRLFKRLKRTNYENEELLSVYREYGVIPKSSRTDNYNQESEDLSSYQLVDVNDLVMNKMKTWQGSIAISKYRGIVSPAYHVYIPNKIFFEVTYPDYIHFLLRTPKYITQYMRRSKGIRVRQWDLNPDEFKSIEILLPEIGTQKKIADFLQKETTKIDYLISEKHTQIKLLNEKKQSVIHSSVTKGIHDERLTKISGLEWVGRIPENWSIVPIFKMFEENKEKNKRIVEKNLLSLSYGRVIRKNIETDFGLLPESFETYQVVDEGYIVLRLTDLQNDKKSLRVGLSTEKGIISSAYVGMIPKMDVYSKYIYYLLHSYDLCKVFYNLGGGLRQTLKYSELKKLKVILPPRFDQIEIVKYIENEVQQIDSLIDDLKKSIELHKEYRSSLITHAVSGQIDISKYEVSK